MFRIDFVRVLSLFPALTSVVFGIIILREFILIDAVRREGKLFNQPGRCSVVHHDCTNMVITLFTLNETRIVEMWNNVEEKYLCAIKSLSYIPCWWSQDPRFSWGVRIGPVSPPFSILLTIALLMILLGAVSVLLLPMMASLALSTRRPYIPEGGADTHGSEEAFDHYPVGNLPPLGELYPLSDSHWKEGVIVAGTPYARRRLDILDKFFIARKAILLEQSEGRTHESNLNHIITDTNFSEQFDDDDVPIDECYVCLSLFRRLIIWWPCGHWICARCARKILRRTRIAECGVCPNCRITCSFQELHILHLFPREDENMVQDSNEDNHGSTRYISVTEPIYSPR